MIKEKELPKAVVSNKLITHKATDLTIMSYDKNVHKLIIPTDLTQAEISDIIVLITFRYHDNVLQISGELVEDKIEIILPNEIRSLSGEFYIEIDINLTDNRQITFARYWGKVVKSDIDSVDLDDAQEFYFELFDDFVQKVADKSEVSIGEIDAHKQSALTSIAQATSDVTDASTQFTVDLADTQSTIDAQVTQAQDSLQEVSDTLTAVNDKVATVNDTADGFTDDVATKQSDVTSKYNAFDTDITEANQTIDDILALQPQFQSVIDETTGKDVISAPELIAARNGELNLKTRLDKEKQEVTAQLAQTDGKTKENKVRMNTETISRRHRKPMITIIDDDGKSEVISRWEPILSEKEFQLSLAVITGSVGNRGYCTWEELEHYKTNYNVELVNHTHTHRRMAELTEEEVIYQFEESTKILKERGHESDIMVYPFGSHNEIVRDVSRRYSRASFDIPNGLNVPPLSTHALNRVTLMPMSGKMETLSYYTDWIDSAIQENAWLVFMSHCHYDSFDIDKIKQIIDYANSKEIEWVTTQEGLDKIGNIIDTGDFAGRARGAEHTVLDADGILHSRANSKDYHYKRPSDFKPIFSTPLTEYPEGHSVAHVQMSDSQGFPKEYGGLVETFRGGAQGSSDTYNYQLYHPIYSNQTYKRTWHRTQENWHTFELIPSQSDIDNQISHLVKKINFYDANTPITEYPDNKVTTFAVNSQNAEGFPETSAGIVTTYKIHLQNWNRQEFRKYRSNELWSRWADGDGVWQSWEKISAV